MPNISITVKNKVARADKVIIVCDNSDYTAVFDFDDEWSAYDTKTVRFVYCGTYTDVVVTGNECPIPEIHDTRSLTVGVYAGDLHTTTPAYISCVPSILCGNGIPADPTPDVYNQIMELLNNISLGGNPATAETLGLIKVGENLKITEDGVLSADQTTANNALDKASAAQAAADTAKADAATAQSTATDAQAAASAAQTAANTARDNAATAQTAADAAQATADTAKVNAAVAQTAANAAQATADTAQTAAADAQAAANTAQSTADNALLIANTQPDWNQNNSTQPDYVKNRPFYTGNPVETVLVEESTVSFTESSGRYIAQFQSTFEATVGETYKVYWDGTVYECTCVDFNGETIIGNLSITGEGSDTGEPFMMAVNNGMKIWIFTADTSAAHTFSISQYSAGEVVKIDEKYLPDLPNDPYIIIKRSISDEYSCNMTYDEIATLYAKYSDASELYDIRYNIFYDDGSRQYRCVNVWHSDNFYFAFVFCHKTGFSSIMVSKHNGIWSGASTDFMDAEKFNSGYYPLIVKSSTAGSTKKFKITVDDSGVITATEVS